MFITADIFVAAAIAYAHSWGSLSQITFGEDKEKRTTNFIFVIDPAEGEDIHTTFKNGELG